MNPYRKQRNFGCRIHDQGTYLGMKTIVMENDVVRISILADKGTEIFEYLYKPIDLDYMWLSSNGVQNPNAYLSTSQDPIANFIDYYPGGWQEVFPNGGPASQYMGADFGQHGEVAHMPWHVEIIEDTPERISVKFCVRTKKVPFLLHKILSLSLGDPRLTIEEELENLGETPLRYMWGQHIAFGKPFLEPGCKIIMPENVQMMTAIDDESEGFARSKRGRTYHWPVAEGIFDDQLIDYSVTPPEETSGDILYLTGFEKTGWYKVENSKQKAGFHVEWDAAAFPYLWYWQEFGRTKGYPWYGRHYNIGLEPFCGYPTNGLSEAVKNDSAGSIQPHEKKSFKMSVSPYKLKNNGRSGTI